MFQPRRLRECAKVNFPAWRLCEASFRPFYFLFMKSHFTALLYPLQSSLWLQSPAGLPAPACGPGTKPAPPAKAANRSPRSRAHPAGVAYGSDPRQILDFWKADTKSTRAGPLFHPRRRLEQRRQNVRLQQRPRRLSESRHFRGLHPLSFGPAAKAAGIKPPVSWPLHDAARALQFVRSKAGEWNLDKTRIAASGGSAGACSSLWLAFHPDMADPPAATPSPGNPPASPAPPWPEPRPPWIPNK